MFANRTIVGLAASVWLCVSLAGGQARESDPLKSNSSLATFLHGRVEVGTRVTRFDLRDNSRPEDPSQTKTFLGYINRLEAEQNDWPVKMAWRMRLAAFGAHHSQVSDASTMVTTTTRSSGVSVSYGA